MCRKPVNSSFPHFCCVKDKAELLLQGDPKPRWLKRGRCLLPSREQSLGPFNMHISSCGASFAAPISRCFGRAGLGMTCVSWSHGHPKLQWGLGNISGLGLLTLGIVPLKGRSDSGQQVETPPQCHLQPNFCAGRDRISSPPHCGAHSTALGTWWVLTK